MKITKADWEAFQDDEAFWPEGACFDDALFRVDGKEVEDIDPALPGSTPIKILSGVVTNAELEPIKSLEAHARKWQKAQSVRQVAIEVPAEIDDKTLREHLKVIGVTLASS